MRVYRCWQFLFIIFCGTKKIDFFFLSLQNVDKLLLDLQDDESVYGGLKEAHGYVNLKVNNIRL